MLSLPYHRFSIGSDRAPIDVARRMAEQTAPRHGWRRPTFPNTRFVGTVNTERFRLVPLIRGMNTYAPRILGRIRTVEAGCVIEGRMTLHPVAVVALLGFLVAPQYWALGERGTLDGVWLAIVAVFHVVMYYAGFVPEVRRTESWMRDVAGRRGAEANERRAGGAMRARR